jgi:hypothetical protein
MTYVRKLSCLGATVVLLVSAGSALAQASPAGKASPPANAPATSEEPPPINPEAMRAMDKMSTALNAMADVAVDSDVTTEQVLTDGQKLQFGGTLSIEAHRPTALKIVAKSDVQNREYYYNGSTLTIAAPTLKYYTSVPAPATMGLMVDRMQTQFGVELPLADLFSWNTNQLIRSRVLSAMVVRPETIDGRACTHYAFRQERVDWQIWIQDGDTPLPCKLVITNTTDPAQPQYVAVLHWRKPGPMDPAMFNFVPPEGFTKIAILDSQGTVEGAGK